MKRVEIVANRSVEEELIGALEALPDFYYTLVPVVHGRGPKDWKLGTVVWPEENFLLFTYQDDLVAEEVVRIVREIKAQFPEEGVKVWTSSAD